MKHRALGAALALILIVFSGCAGNSSRDRQAMFSDLGIINVSNGVPITRTLADGRTCILTPTILNHATIQLTLTVEGKNGAGGSSTYTLVTTLPTEQKSLLTIDRQRTISLTIHEAE